LEAVAGFTRMALELTEGNVPEVKVSVIPLAAFVTYKPLKLATPLAGVAVWALAVVAFMVPPLVSATVMAVAYEATVLPYVSLTVTLGWMGKAVPAVAVDDGCWVITSCEALAALTLIPAEGTEVKVPELNVSVTPLAALVTKRPLKLATPLEGITVCAVVVALRLPPLVSATVMGVL
jgi:hypothetical protein